MFTLIKIELQKVFSRRRTYIGFIAIAILVTVLEIAFYLDGNRFIDFATQTLKDSFIFTGNLMNGYLVCFIVLQGLIVHVPLLVSVVAGELLAGEATGGTFRFLLTRPISRTNIVLAKFITACIYTIMLVIWLCIVSLGLGQLLFGSGDLIVMKTDIITILAADDVLWRFACAFGFAMLSMCNVAALALMFSSLVENAVGPIVSTMVVVIIMVVISAMDVEVLNNFKPFMFTTHMNAWKLFFEETLDKREILKSAGVLVLHIVAFLSITIYVFNKKDVLS